MSERLSHPIPERSSIGTFEGRFEHYLKSNDLSLLLFSVIQELESKPDAAEDLSEWLRLLGYRVRARMQELDEEYKDLDEEALRARKPLIKRVPANKVPGADLREPSAIKAQEMINAFRVGYGISEVGVKFTNKESLVAGLKELQHKYEDRQAPFIGPVLEV